MTLSGLEPWVLPAARWALDVARYYGVPVTVTSVRRSRRKQAALRAAWLAGRSKWPANAPGNSAHEFGLAWDSVVPDQYQAWWNHVRELAGFRIPSRDVIHAEVPDWRSYT